MTRLYQQPAGIGFRARLRYNLVCTVTPPLAGATGLSLAKTDRPHCLHGIAEADELYVLESEKSTRHLARLARRRSSHARKRGISNEQVCT